MKNYIFDFKLINEFKFNLATLRRVMDSIEAFLFERKFLKSK